MTIPPLTTEPHQQYSPLDAGDEESKNGSVPPFNTSSVHIVAKSIDTKGGTNLSIDVTSMSSKTPIKPAHVNLHKLMVAFTSNRQLNH